MVAWLDLAQASELRSMVVDRATRAARRLVQSAGHELPADFDLEREEWRAPFLQELELRLEEDTSDDDSTSNVPDYARFATDLRTMDQLQSLVERLTREADVDLGAAFGWED